MKFLTEFHDKLSVDQSAETAQGNPRKYHLHLSVL